MRSRRWSHTAGILTVTILVVVAGVVSAAGAVDSPRPNAARSSYPPFVTTTALVSPVQLGASWHRGCPVAANQLRVVALSYFGFDGRAHVGHLVVNQTVVSQVVQVFKTLYSEHFPIRQMVPVAAFGGNDPRSMAADNTSGFNCRLAVTTGPPAWSVHAFGKAIDVDPLENPYLETGKAEPSAGASFLNRNDVRPGMAEPGGDLNRAFAAVGWFWGGRWTTSPDYQHFSSTGG